MFPVPGVWKRYVSSKNVYVGREKNQNAIYISNIKPIYDMFGLFIKKKTNTLIIDYPRLADS